MILIGLGNPGKQYENTRHNAGKMFVRWMKQGRGTRDEGRGNFDARESESFMNESGDFVYKIYNHYNSYKRYKNYNDLFIVHDDLDLSLGNFKIQFGKGPKQHHGILSIEEALGTKEFWRVRIGTDNRIAGPAARHPAPTSSRSDAAGARAGARFASPVSGEDYVLSNFSKEERKILEADVFPKIQEKLKKALPCKTVQQGRAL